jgi:pilus assembly protein TadC
MIGVGPIVGSAVAIGAFLVPVVRHRAEQLAIDGARWQSVPELVDLFRLAVGAGLSVHQVVDVVEPHVPAVFAPTLTEVRRRVSLGQRLGDALDAFDDAGEPVRPLASVLRAAAFDGVALGPALERVAADARLQRRRWAEINARKLPVQLLFPLGACILPAFGLLAIVPLVVSSLGSLHW